MTSSDIYLAVKIQQARYEIKQLPLSSNMNSNTPAGRQVVPVTNRPAHGKSK